MVTRARTAEKESGPTGHRALRNVCDRTAGTPLGNAVTVRARSSDPQDPCSHQRNGEDAASGDPPVRIVNYPGRQRSGLVEALEVEPPVCSSRQDDRSEDTEIGPIGSGIVRRSEGSF